MAVDVAVVIPAYNAEAYIETTLASVLAQDGVELEVVVVDDGSTDRSVEIAAALAGRDTRLRVVRQSNAGVAAARNAGAAAVSAEARYLHFLDADDVLVPGALHRLKGRLDADPTLHATFGTCSRIDAAGAVIAPAPERAEVHFVDPHGRVALSLDDRIGFWHILPITPISTPGQCMIRRSVLGAEPAFEQACAPCEDWDLWLRVSRSGDIGVEGHEVLQYRDHAVSASKQHLLMRRQRHAVYVRHARSIRPDEVDRFRAAYRFGMYQFDARLCMAWARASWDRGDRVGALRFAQRAVRHGARGVGARVTGRPRT